MTIDDIKIKDTDSWKTKIFKLTLTAAVAIVAWIMVLR